MSRLKLDTLIRLRWLAVAGQAITLLGVHLFFGFPLPLAACFAVVAASVWLNIVLRLRFPASKRLSDTHALFSLGFDVVQLAILLFFTGGMQNPFAFLFLVPVMVSAASLSPARTLVLGSIVLVLAALLTEWHWPLPWAPENQYQAPILYVMGMWVALASSMIFMALYAFRVADEARQLSNALTATELVLAREQHLSQLDGLAAAAAHELGTPLATIALVAKELERDLPKEGPHVEDITLLREQIRRCRDIMAKLTSLGEEKDTPFARMRLSHLIEEAVSPYREFGIEIAVILAGDGEEPIGRRNPGLLYGLGNLIENGVDFAATKVEVRAEWTASIVTISISDDGPGFPSDIMDRLGEPFVTSRGKTKREPAETADKGDFDMDFGMGLGFFIAKTLIERTQGQIRLNNQVVPMRGAHIRITWPREALEDAPEEDLAREAPAATLRQTRVRA